MLALLGLAGFAVWHPASGADGEKTVVGGEARQFNEAFFARVVEEVGAHDKHQQGAHM